MLENKIAFLDYPRQYVNHTFDKVKLDLFPGRNKHKARMDVYHKGQVVARFYPQFDNERFFEQLTIEMDYAEENENKNIKYEININGEFPSEQLN